MIKVYLLFINFQNIIVNFFPGIKEQISQFNFYQIDKPILNISLFKSFQPNLNQNLSQVSQDEIFNLNFNYSTEYISKPYSYYSKRPINKIFFLSNLYKIFILNIPNNLSFTTFDFFSLTTLLCPDFPKISVKKLNIIISNFSNNNLTPEIFNENIELKAKVNIIEFFCIFSVYYLFNDLFFEIDKLFININSSQCLIKDLKKIKGMKNELLYSSLILCNQKLINEFNLNTINTIEEVDEILEKNGDIKVPFATVYEKILKNKDIIESIFSVDQTANEYLNLINYIN